jgi:hypothetical protein
VSGYQNLGGVLDIVLGVSMAPSSIQMVVLEGENAEGATVEEDEFDVTAADESNSASAPDHVISAILGTRESAAEAGLQLSSIGVTWTDQVEAAVLRDALAIYKLENVMLVSAFLAATALTQSVGGAMGYDRTAVLFVEPESATLAVVETSDGSITDLYKEQIDDTSNDEVTAQLTGMVAGLEEMELAPGGVFLVGSGVDIASIKPALESATSLDVSAPEEPQTALARGAALASANAPLFASSTAALAYAQDPGTGAVDPYALPEYLSVSGVSPDAELGDGDIAYSAVPDEDADAPTVLIDTPVSLNDSQPRRRPVLLLGSGLAVAGITAVVALEIALAIGIRTTVALQPTPGQNLIVPAEQAPVPPNPVASVAQPKIEAPVPVAAPKPLNLPAPAPVPAALPAPAPAAPVVPVPVVVPPAIVPVPAPPIHLSVPDPISHPPLVQVPTRQLPPEQPVFPQPRGQVPSWQPQGGSPGEEPPIHQTPPGQGTPPRPRSPAGGGPIHGGAPGGGGPLGGDVPGGGGPFGGGAPGEGPFGGGGLVGGGAPREGPFGGGGLFGGGGPFGGGAPGEGSHGGGGPFGGGAPGGGGPFGGGEPGGGQFGGGGFGGGHGSGGGGFGGGGFGGGGFGGGGLGGGGHSGGGGGHGGGGHR